MSIHAIGVAVLHSDNITVTHLTVEDFVDYAVQVEATSRPVIEDSQVCGGVGTGVLLYEVEDWRVYRTRLVSHGVMGIIAGYCTGGVLADCFIANVSYGVHLFSLHDTLVTRNTIVDCTNVGIEVVYNAQSTRVFANRIGGNGVDAVDNGINTAWDDGAHLGNAWGSYDGSGVYEVEGQAGSVDHYPTTLMFADVQVSHVDDMEVEAWAPLDALVWEPQCEVPYWYQVYVDDALASEGSWDGGSVTVRLPGLPSGRHTVTFVAYDEHYNSVVDRVTVVAGPGEPPIVSGPPDMQVDPYSTGNVIVWDASDAAPYRYVILCNGTSAASSSWSGGNITFLLPPLGPGTYDYTIVLWDRNNNAAQDTVFVFVPPAATTTTNTTSTGNTSSVVVPGEQMAVIVGVSVAAGVTAVVVAVLYVRLRQKRSAQGPSVPSPEEILLGGGDRGP